MSRVGGRPTGRTAAARSDKIAPAAIFPSGRRKPDPAISEGLPPAVGKYHPRRRLGVGAMGVLQAIALAANHHDMRPLGQTVEGGSRQSFVVQDLRPVLERQIRRHDEMHSLIFPTHDVK
jgi:hypothetical protein